MRLGKNWPEAMAAVPLDKYKGKRYWRFPVEIVHGEIAAIRQVNVYPRVLWYVIAASAAEAGSWAMDQQAPGEACIEVIVYGPRGGKAKRYWRGWGEAFATMLWPADGKKEVQPCIPGL